MIKAITIIATTTLFSKLSTIDGKEVNKDQIPKIPLTNATEITNVKYNQICFLAEEQSDSIFAPNIATV